MKTAYITLGAAGILMVFAACHSWAGDATQAATAPMPQVRGGNTVAFVEGDEAEPPAMPDGTPMPAPRNAEAPKQNTPHPVAAKVSAYPTPETVKRHVPMRVMPAAAVAPAKQAPASANIRWND